MYSGVCHGVLVGCIGKSAGRSIRLRVVGGLLWCRCGGRGSGCVVCGVVVRGGWVGCVSVVVVDGGWDFRYSPGLWAWCFDELFRVDFGFVVA